MTKGKLIQIARKNAGLTQKDLAKQLTSLQVQSSDANGRGKIVSQAQISDYENDRRSPKMETLDKIATVLEIPVTAYAAFIIYAEADIF